MLLPHKAGVGVAGGWRGGDVPDCQPVMLSHSHCTVAGVVWGKHFSPVIQDAVDVTQWLEQEQILLQVWT